MAKRRKGRSGGARDFPADRRVMVVAASVIVLLVLVGVGGKVMADRSANSATEERALEIERLLSDATPDDFLAFNAGVKEPGSIAQTVRDQPDFVNVKATADLSFIRFQPGGWWAGFTERCIVAAVGPDDVLVTVPKTACVRVEVPKR